MSMYIDKLNGAEGNKERCEYNSQTIAGYARRFPRGHWSAVGPGPEEQCGTEPALTYLTDPGTEWQRI